MLRVELAHSFGRTVFDMAFEAPTPGVISLFGPSGAGKSSLLLAIAGLLPARHVRVELDGVALHAMPPQRRRIGTVFQDGRLFPHLSVRGNLRYGLVRAAAGPVGFDDVVALLGLEHLLDRRPASLSGGERQRVAIGRALLGQPRLLLMDEPLSALDQARRDEIIPYLARLRGTLRIPIVYASHSLDEVLRLADTLVLIEAGRVVQAGTLADIVSQPGSALATRGDASGVLSGSIASHDADRQLTAIACGPDVVLVRRLEMPPGTRVRLIVPAREVILATETPRAISVNNILPARIASLAFDEAGLVATVALDLAGGRLLARVTLDAVRRLGLQPGQGILALVKAVSVELSPE